jgi:hypothetical protein
MQDSSQIPLDDLHRLSPREAAPTPSTWIPHQPDRRQRLHVVVAASGFTSLLGAVGDEGSGYCSTRWARHWMVGFCT